MKARLIPLAPVLVASVFPEIGVAEEGISALGDFTVAQAQSPVSIVVLLTMLSFVPFMMIALTTFTRNIVVLSLVRQALGLQQTPPNIVLIVLSLFLTLFVMAPTLEKAYDAGAKPFLANSVNLEQAAQLGWVPIRELWFDKPMSQTCD